jgi:hypothetical protein
MKVLFKTTRVHNRHGQFENHLSMLHGNHEAGTRSFGTNPTRHYANQAAFISNLQQLKNDFYQTY